VKIVVPVAESKELAGFKRAKSLISRWFLAAQDKGGKIA
jgi:hypothetical protein